MACGRGEFLPAVSGELAGFLQGGGERLTLQGESGSAGVDLLHQLGIGLLRGEALPGGGVECGIVHRTFESEILSGVLGAVGGPEGFNLFDRSAGHGGDELEVGGLLFVAVWIDGVFESVLEGGALVGCQEFRHLVGA